MRFSLLPLSLLLALPLLVSASPLNIRQDASGSTSCDWQCTLPSDASPVSALSPCSPTNTTCICPPLAQLSPLCLDCHLSSLSLTYAQYLDTCVYPAQSSSSAKATGTGKVILPGNGTTASGGAQPTNLSETSGSGRSVLVGGGVVLGAVGALVGAALAV